MLTFCLLSTVLISVFSPTSVRVYSTKDNFLIKIVKNYVIIINKLISVGEVNFSCNISFREPNVYRIKFKMFTFWS